MKTSHQEEMGIIFEALTFAAEKHKQQRRKDQAASPYINHPIALVNLLWLEGKIYDTRVIVAALLHDTVEDTETTFAEIEGLFGEEIMSIVREVTDDKSLPKALRKQKQIEKTPSLSREAKLVKLADKINNLQDLIDSPPIHWSTQQKYNYTQWAKQVIDGLRGTNSFLEAQFDRLYQEALEKFS